MVASWLYQSRSICLLTQHAHAHTRTRTHLPQNGEWAFVPAAVGFFLGAAFVYGADLALPLLGFQDGLDVVTALKEDAADSAPAATAHSMSLRKRKSGSKSDEATGTATAAAAEEEEVAARAAARSWRRTFLLAMAVRSLYLVLCG
jgi:hypothetical protein